MLYVVIALFKDNDLELLVQNTGQLSPKPNEDGFGIKSTQDRLNLMYQGKAVFQIRNLGTKMVESKVSIPVLFKINIQLKIKYTMQKALIIDDERLARNELKKLLLEFPEIEVVGEAANAAEGLGKN